jgi:hypothetical protein
MKQAAEVRDAVRKHLRCQSTTRAPTRSWWRAKRGSAATPMQGSGVVGVVGVRALGQMNPIIVGCRPIVPGVLAIHSSATPFWPVIAVANLIRRGQHSGKIQTILSLVGSGISGIGRNVPLLGGSQDLVGVLHALVERGLSSRHIGLTTLEVALASFGVRPGSFSPPTHGESEPLEPRNFEGSPEKVLWP